MATRRFIVDITKFRVRDVVITRSSVSRIVDTIKDLGTLDRILYQGYEIFPRNRIRADGRLEIPHDITERFGLWEKAPTVIIVDVVYTPFQINITELVVYLKYIPGKKPQEYKLMWWVETEDRFMLTAKYEDLGKRMFFRVFHWLRPYRRQLEAQGYGPYFGFTNRVSRPVSTAEFTEIKKWALALIYRPDGELKYAKEGLIRDILFYPGDVWVQLRSPVIHYWMGIPT